MTIYYEEFVIREGVRQPLALFRRDVQNDINVDRIYSKDGTWLPTGELAIWSHGLGDLDIERVDEAAAEAFIALVTARNRA